MITLRKLASLPEGTRHRKTLTLVREFEARLASKKDVDTLFLRGLMNQVAADGFWDLGSRTEAREICEYLDDPTPGGSVYGELENLHRKINNFGHDLASFLGRDWADWDAIMPADRLSAGDGFNLQPFRIYLDSLRSPFNVGSIFRTVLAFGGERVWVSPECASPDHKRSIRSAMGAVDAVEWSVVNLDQLDSSQTGPLFALELGGTPVSDFAFPTAGTVILGSEELGVNPRLLERAASDGGIVSIPLPGPKASLNVGVAFGILMEHWVRTLSPGHQTKLGQ